MEQQQPAHNDNKTSSLEHVLKYTGIFGGVQGLTILMNIVRSNLASRLLGGAGMGLMGIFIAIADFVNSTTNFGLPFSSVRSLSELFSQGNEDEIRHFVKVIRTWSAWTAVLAGIVCVGCAPLLGDLFFENDVDAGWTTGRLAPMVMAMSITAGEVSILKGLRRLKRVAIISAIGTISTLLLTIPFFWAMGIKGIVLALNVSVIALMCIHLSFTLPIYAWRIAPFSRIVLREGLGMIRVGIPYVLAAIAGSGVAMLLPALLKRYGSMADVGYYRAGYGLMVTYAGIVYTAFEADFFPRLSSVNHDIQLRNQTINQQIRVCMLLVTPLLIGLVIAMPIVLRLLYAPEFTVVTGMAVCAAFYMFLRGITTPISYTALACGDSLLYLLMEVIYDVVSLTVIVLSFRQWGLMGAGIGLSLSALFDFFLIGIGYRLYYRFRLNGATAQLATTQALLLALAVAACFALPAWGRFCFGTILFGLSGWRSYHVLSTETNVIDNLRRKWQQKRRGHNPSTPTSEP